MPYQYQPDISVKLSPRITKQTKVLIDRICRRNDLFEHEVLRLCMETAVPVASKRGMAWLIRQIPGFDRNLKRELDSMVTVRTSRRIKDMIDKLKAPYSDYTENEVVRYCYDYVLPIANREGFAKVMAMRERGLRGI